ncbi:MAG: TonB-dependent receptor [Hyphomonadaceae bacterium]|nr:MAG: TonB-dependent receptor [Hyphomonadaceae bacterium]
MIGLGLATISTVAFSSTAFAQAASDEIVVVTGTRVAARSALNTAAPIDVVSAAQLSQSGTSELNQALAQALPSLNFPRPSLADGSDTIRPATLRGLAPDQTLVLVNSKRRHSASLVNINGTVGRGSAAVDMNTIPSGIIKAVEVLRDGASAQYGSDAIAGVINVRLKEENSGGGVTFSFGENATTVSTLVGATPTNATWTVDDKAKYDRNDGQRTTISAWAGIPLGSAGFLTVAGEYLKQDHGVRTAPDWRQQYALLQNGAFDPREVTFNRYDAWYGEPEVLQLTLFANAGYTLSESAELYGWASAQNRQSVSPGFFRRASDARNTTAIYPDGFLPKIAPEVDDVSGGLGMKWKAGTWDMDLSLVGGFNAMDFVIRDTLNRTYGAASRTQFDAGGFDYTQFVANLSGVRTYEMGLASPLNVAVGIEARRENYSIHAGDVDSWADGGQVAGGAPGAQVFPGFRPANEVSPSRTSFAGYLDLEANLSDNFLVSGAIRAESYEDFGETVTGKLSARWDISDNFALRGSVQNGFRAPSLQQIGFTTTSTNFIGGVPFDITTFTPNSAVARALGAKPLEPEESVNFALGSVIRMGAFNVTIDGYQINIDNRIVLSENLTQSQVRRFLTNSGFPSIGGGRFFINGVDTETRGVDIIANWRTVTDNIGRFNFTFGANFNDTKVTRIPVVAALSTLPLVTGETAIATDGLFARVNKLTFERGQPKDKFNFSTEWSFNRVGATFRATRYGEVLAPGTTGVAGTTGADLILDPRILLDIEGRFKVTERIKVAVGADNFTDEYPTQTPALLNGTSNTPFSNLSPFGRSGRYVYGRVTYEW